MTVEEVLMKDLRYELTQLELEKLDDLLYQLEKDALAPYENINGGFSKAEVFNYDDEYIDVELVYGVQCGGDDYEYTEQLCIERKTMEVVD
jgi:hypothetical protein